MDAESESAKQPDTSPNRIVINYIKSNYFRVIHSDGAWVGLTPSLAVNIGFFNERVAIPQRMAHEIDPSGALGAEIPSERRSKDGMVREIEASVIMQPDRVKALIDVLQKTLDHINDLNISQVSPESHHE